MQESELNKTELHLRQYPVLRGWEAVAELHRLARKGNRGYIAGSYAAYMAAEGHIIAPGDIDIFTTGDMAFASLVDDVTLHTGRTITRMTKIAYTMEVPIPVVTASTITATPPLAVQIIKPHPAWEFYPTDIVQSFDITVSRAILLDENTIWGDDDLGKTEGKILRVNNPMKTLERVAKYSRRGITFDQWELSKVLKALDAMDEKARSILLDEVQNPAEPPIQFDEDYGDWYDEDDWFRGE